MNNVARATRASSRLCLGVALLVAFIFGGCAGQSAPTPVTTFRMSLGSDPQTFDPGFMSGSVEGQIAYQLFEGLLSPPPGEGPPRGGVASTWDVSPDGRTWTFHLRPEARWSNGDRLTAEDFRYAWLRQLRGDVASDYVSFIRFIEGARAWELIHARLPSGFAFVATWLERRVGIEARDAHTLVVRLQNPTAYFADIVMFYTMMPVHRRSIERWGQQDAFSAENLVSNGAFRIETYARRSHMHLVRNEHWWGRESLRIHDVEVRIIEDLAARATAYLDGRIDWTDELPHNQLGVLSARADFRSAPQLGVYYYRFNVTAPPLDDVRVRQALSLAVNRAELCGCALDGLYDESTMFVPPLPGFRRAQLVRFDPDRARQLLAEAGYPGGRGFPTLSILYNTSENHRTVAQAVQDMWRTELGINVQLVNQEWKVYLEEMEALRYQVARAGWIGDYVDPDTFLSLWRSFDENNNTGWQNPEYDALMARTLTTVDPVARQADLARAEELLLEEAPVMPIYFYSQFHLVRPEIRGWEMNIRDVHLLQYVWREPSMGGAP